MIWIEMAPLLTLYMDNPKSRAFIYFWYVQGLFSNKTQPRFSSVCKKHHFFIYSLHILWVIFLREDYIFIHIVLPISWGKSNYNLVIGL